MGVDVDVGGCVCVGVVEVVDSQAIKVTSEDTMIAINKNILIFCII